MKEVVIVGGATSAIRTVGGVNKENYPADLGSIAIERGI